MDNISNSKFYFAYFYNKNSRYFMEIQKNSTSKLFLIVLTYHRCLNSITIGNDLINKFSFLLLCCIRRYVQIHRENISDLIKVRCYVMQYQVLEFTFGLQGIGLINNASHS